MLLLILSAELEGLQRAASLAAEEHERNMGAYRTQIENRMKELESKCSELGMLQIENEAEKARNFAERQEVLGNFDTVSMFLVFYPFFFLPFYIQTCVDLIFPRVDTKTISMVQGSS